MARLRVVLRGLGLFLVFVTALVGGVLLHADRAAPRRAIGARVTALLATVIPGRIVIDGVGHLGLGDVSGLDVRILDPDGTVVVGAQGASGSIDLGRLLDSLRSDGPIVVALADVHVTHADVSLDAVDGKLRLTRTFVRTTPSAGAARPLDLELPSALVDDARVSGRPTAASPLVDLDVRDARAALHKVPEALTVALTSSAVTVQDVPPGGAAVGALEAHLVQEPGGAGGRVVELLWRGTIAGSPAGVALTMRGDAYRVTASLPDARPESIAAAWPSSPLREPVTVDATLSGAPQLLFVAARLTSGTTALDVRGPLGTGPTRTALRVQSAGLDGRLLGLSASSLDVSGELVAATSDGAVAATAALDASGTFGAARVPSTSVVATASRASATAPWTAHVRALAREPGAPLNLVADLKPKGSAYVATFDASANVPDLNGVLRVGPLAHGSGRVAARGTVDLAAKTVDANVSAQADDVSAGSVKLRHAVVSGRAHGPLTSPQLDATVEGTDLDAAGAAVGSFHATVHGPATGAAVAIEIGGETGHLRASATVGVGAGTVSVRDVKVVGERSGEHLELDAESLVKSGASRGIDDAEIRGLGAPLRVSAQSNPSGLAVVAQSEGIDLAKLARLVGTKAPVSGHAAVDVDATLRPEGGDGHLNLDVTDATFGALHGIEAHVAMNLSGRTVSGTVTASLAGVASIDLRTEALHLAGTGALGPSSWSSAWGSAEVSAHVDLAAVAARLPPGTLPVSRVAGMLDVHGRVGRDSPKDDSPAVDLSAQTTGLALTGPAASPWSLHDTEWQADLTVDGTTARTSVESRLVDAKGVVASLDVGSENVPYGPLFARSAPPLVLLRAVRVAGALALPERDLADLPAWLGTRDLQGKLGMLLSYSGTIDQPTLDLQASLSGGRTDQTVLALPFDLAIAGHYDGAQLQGRVIATSRKRTMLQATMTATVREADVLGHLGDPTAELPWTASAMATLDRFPLQSLAVLDERQVRGHASGTALVVGLHDDARASVDLSSDDLTIGEVACKSAHVQGLADGRELSAMVRVTETTPKLFGLAHEDGSIEAVANVGARWGAALAPRFDPTQPAMASLQASAFRAQLIQPLLSSVFAELDGRVDGNLQVTVDPATRTVRPLGNVRLSDGVFEIASLGGEFHDATAEIDVGQDGVVLLENASAKGLSGELQAAASARFAGFDFVGARGQLQVPRQNPLPLVFDGVQVGMFQGKASVAVDAVAAAQGGGYDVKVDVPEMLLALPIQSTQKVQKLGPMDGVTVGIARPGQAFVETSLEGPAQPTSAGRGKSPLRITVALTNGAEIKQGSTLDVYLGGSPSVVVADQVTASGQVRLERGTLQVQGKTFSIENGTVTFVSDPTNPQVVLTASWPAPDGTTIYADFVGPLKTGKVTLRSDPPHTQNEILSLLLFGTTDDQTASFGDPTQQQAGAVGAAGGAATEPINQALGGVNQMLDSFGLVGGLSTRVDTSQTTPRPEVELQIARDISIQVAWVLGVPPPGSNPDSTLFTLDWRFLRSWSLETTVGDAGTSVLDLIWQHRY